MFRCKKSITDENKFEENIPSHNGEDIEEEKEYEKIHNEFAKNIKKNNESLEDILKRTGDTLFTEIKEFYDDDSITDIEWDGENLWITQIGKGCYKVDKKLSKEYTENLAARLSNIMKVNFTPNKPVLEAHTDNLRISVFHESRCGKKSFTIRKIPTNLRYSHEQLVESGTLPEELLNFLENCVIAHCNVIIGGRPHAGKTELLKYLSGFIPENEKVITLEDNVEIHYKQIYKNRKSVQFLVDSKYDYTDAISACLRHDVDWLLLSEARGPEVLELLNALSTGSFCMTTIHTDSVADIPDRMYNMLGSGVENPRFINNIYRYIDVGLIIKADKKENRLVSEIGFFDRENGENIYIPFYNTADGIVNKNNFSSVIKKEFEKYNITEPFTRYQLLRES